MPAAVTSGTVTPARHPRCLSGAPDAPPGGHLDVAGPDIDPAAQFPRPPAGGAAVDPRPPPPRRGPLVAEHGVLPQRSTGEQPGPAPFFEHDAHTPPAALARPGGGHVDAAAPDVTRPP